METKIINNIKSLAIDMIDAAGSGHPGIVLSSAPILYTLYAHHININTNDPKWVTRDRFVMSAGHGSALLYATLHMAGFPIDINNLKKFRQYGSITPGHPEYNVTPGIDMSTGPLGQGLASAVGMAIGEKIIEEKYLFPKVNKNFKGHSLVDYKIYVLVGDGDLMEGISYEAASLAGTLKLDNLIVLYDSNNISLDGSTKNTFTENVCDRFKAMGWDTQIVKNGESVIDINKAINKAKQSNKPSFIEIKTVLGKGSILENSNEVHGKLLSKEDILQLKQKLEIPNQPFYIDEYAKTDFRDKIVSHSHLKYDNWSNNYHIYVKDILNGNNAILKYLFSNEINIDFTKIDFEFDKNKKEATRDTNSYIMNKLEQEIDNLVGGSADLASSTKVILTKSTDISANNFNGKNIWFGVREHAMGAILNGLALSNLRPFGSTFLVFADYLKPAIRLSCLMNLPVTYIFTHDSISIGQDGPTHQPIEQLASLRGVPNLLTFRPADFNELLGCWSYILKANKPCALVLSRNEVPLLENSSPNGVFKGAYIVNDVENPHAILIATGSEVATAIYLANDLKREHNVNIRVVSMPEMKIFLAQSKEYQDLIIPKTVQRFVLEYGSNMCWHQFVYNDNYLFNIDHYGVSAIKDDVLKHCNLDFDKIKNKILKML